MSLQKLGAAINKMNDLASTQTEDVSLEFVQAVREVAREIDVLIASGVANTHPEVLQQALVGLTLVAVAIGISRKTVSVESAIRELMGDRDGSRSQETSL